jgi:hypothetical protein
VSRCAGWSPPSKTAGWFRCGLTVITRCRRASPARKASFTEVQNDPDRVITPLRRTREGAFEPVSWDAAMSDIADRLGHIHKWHGPGAVGW